MADTRWVRWVLFPPRDGVGHTLGLPSVETDAAQSTAPPASVHKIVAEVLCCPLSLPEVDSVQLLYGPEARNNWASSCKLTKRQTRFALDCLAYMSLSRLPGQDSTAEKWRQFRLSVKRQLYHANNWLEDYRKDDMQKVLNVMYAEYESKIQHIVLKMRPCFALYE